MDDDKKVVDPTTSMLSEFAKLVQEGKKAKQEAEAKKKQNFFEKYKIENTEINPFSFISELAKLKKAEETPEEIIEKVSKEIAEETLTPTEPIVEEKKPTANELLAELASLIHQGKEANKEVFEQQEEHLEPFVAEMVQEIVELQKEEIKEESKPVDLISKTVESISKVAENNRLSEVTNLFSTPEPEKTPSNLKAIQTKLKSLEQWVSKISTAGPGSGSYWLNDLGDTDKTSLQNATDGQVLTFSADLGKWTAADSIGGGGGTVDTNARNLAQNAYDKANSGYDYANTIPLLDQWARNTANSATSNTIIIQGVDAWQNTQITYVNQFTQSAYDYANTIVSDTQIDPYARNKANSAIILAQQAYDQANVQPDWNQTDNTAVDFIKNKPTIPDITPFQDVLTVTSEPMGHEDKSQSTITFNNSTRTFTISPVGSYFEVWVKGTKHTFTTPQSVTLPNTTGEYYIYFDENGLGVQTSFFVWDQQAPTSIIYYNAVTGLAPYFADERHGTTLDWQTHEYLHRTRGAVIANGFAIGNYTVGGAVQIDIGNGCFFDEDLQIDVTHSNTPTANTWEQDLQGPAQIPMFYLSGTGWVRDEPTGYVNKQGTSRPRYNLLSGGTWSTADIDNNKYGTTFIVATNNLTYPIIGIMSQSAHANQGAAEALEFSDLVLTGFPVAEFRLLYKVVFKADSTHGTLTSVWDLRQLSATTPSAAVGSDHGLLSGLGDDDHPQYLLRTDSNSIYDKANLAYSAAQSAFDKANTSIQTSGNQVVTGSLTANAATAFIAGDAAISGVALQIPREGGIRNMTNGTNNMYFDVSNGGTTDGGFVFRSSSSFTELLYLSTSGLRATSAYKAKQFNGALDSEVSSDNLKFRITNSGGVFPQVGSTTGSNVDISYTLTGVVSGVGAVAIENSGTLVNGYTTIFNTHGLDTRGDMIIAHVVDKNAGRVYRVTYIVTNNSSNTTGYSIVIERII